MKHAYLIMAHSRPDLLSYLITALDDNRNDIFIHIDVKAKNQKWKYSTEKAGLYLINSMDVKWAEYSQVECEYRLLEKAFQNGPYDYYHFMTGVTYPLKNQDYIHAFFESNKGIEFIGFDNKKDFSERVMYKHLFLKQGKRTGIKGRVMNKIEQAYISLQRMFGINMFEKYKMECKKGLAYWSVTNDLVEYVLSKEKLIKEMLEFSVSGDEIFVQTLVFNSRFKEKIYNYDDEFEGCLREMPWEDRIRNRGEHSFYIDDAEYLLSSNKLFALKFDGMYGLELIKIIKEASNI